MARIIKEDIRFIVKVWADMCEILRRRNEKVLPDIREFYRDVWPAVKKDLEKK